MKELQNWNSSNNNKLLIIVPIEKVEDYLLNECLYSLANQQQAIDVLLLTKNLSEDDKKAVERIAQGPKIMVNEKDKKGEMIRVEKSSVKDLHYTIENTDAKTFNQIFNQSFNYARLNKYTYFSVVEPDDIVSARWYAYAVQYADATKMDGFLPLTREISNGVFLGFFNEACWVENFAEVAGVYDLSLLLRYNCMNITGTMFKTESLEKLSEFDGSNYKPIKESIKTGYVYEFFLRMIYNDLKFTTIPRIGYEHRIDRPTQEVSYFTSKLPRDITTREPLKGGISMEEAKFWSELVKKEYYFEEDRNLKYNPA